MHCLRRPGPDSHHTCHTCCGCCSWSCHWHGHDQLFAVLSYLHRRISFYQWLLGTHFRPRHFLQLDPWLAFLPTAHQQYEHLFHHRRFFWPGPQNLLWHCCVCPSHVRSIVQFLVWHECRQVFCLGRRKNCPSHYPFGWAPVAGLGDRFIVVIGLLTPCGKSFVVCALGVLPPATVKSLR